MRLFLLIFAGFLTGCATPVNIPQPQGKRLPTAGEHLPPPDLLSPTISSKTPNTNTKRSQGCFSIYSPVCGSNGETYGNACTARGQGIQVISKGECTK